MIFYTSVARKIAFLRRKKGFTQREFAKRCDISSSYLSKIESGDKIRGCSLELIFSFSKALGVALNSLLTLSPQEKLTGVLYASERGDKEPLSAQEVESIYRAYTK